MLFPKYRNHSNIYTNAIGIADKYKCPSDISEFLVVECDSHSIKCTVLMDDFDFVNKHKVYPGTPFYQLNGNGGIIVLKYFENDQSFSENDSSRIFYEIGKLYRYNIFVK